MKKVIKTLLLFIILSGIIMAVPFFIHRSSADEADYTEITVTPTPGAGPTPTDNKYHILEIVPYKALGEMRYLVGGQECIDEDLFTSDSNAKGMLSFLGGAISSYKAYRVKDLPASGTQDNGWVPIKTYASQDGYFKYVGYGNGYYQKKTNQTEYSRVADGTGNYKAVLDTENTDIYTGSWDQTNYKNVNAYFAFGTNTGASLYSNTNTYQPVSVIRTTDHKGDYDYNADKASFELNKGKGEYDVLFKRTSGGANSYYMTNDYEIVDDCSGEYSWSLTYSGVATGNYVRNTAATTFTYNQWDHSNCAYNWVEDSGANAKANFTVEGEGTQNEKIWIQNEKVITMKEYSFAVTLVNNEWFKRLVLGLTDAQSDKTEVVVNTLTPTQLNLPENQHYLKEANIFYINQNYSHNNNYITLYESYSHEGLNLSLEQKFNFLQSHNLLNFGVNDLNWTSTMLLFNRIAGVKSDKSLGGYRATVVFDYKLYSNAISGSEGYGPYHDNVTVNFSENGSDATVSNMAKLYIMTYQRDAAQFYKLFLSPTALLPITEVSGTGVRNSTGTTGSFIRLGSSAAAKSVEATFWNGNTFCPYYVDDSGTLINWTDWWNHKGAIAQYIPNFNISHEPTDMTSSVLVFNGRDIFTEKFIEPAKDMPPEALEEAKSYLKSIGVDVSSMNNLTLFNYLVTSTDSGTGYGNGIEESGSGTGGNGTSGSNLRSYYSILNIEPTADYTASEININKMFANINIKITNMTSAEFNENILDINTHYDMIYIGGAVGRFNKSGSDTAFNNSGLNKSAYNTGDSVNTSEGSKTYTGNDLTDQKIGELYNYLQADYPIVMESGIYSIGVKVQKAPKLKSFLQTVTVAGSQYMDSIFNYDSFFNTVRVDGKDQQVFQPYGDQMTNLKKQLNIERPQIQMITPVTISNDETDVIHLATGEELVITFSVLPNKNYEDDSIYYSAYLYMDYNNNGIFSDNEIMNANLIDGISNIGFKESSSTEHKYTYKMDGYNGAHRWKVEVIRQSKDVNGNFHDTPIRSEITGYVTYTDRQKIKIIQIMDNSDSETQAYSLQKAVTDPAKSSSLIRKYAGFGLTPISPYRTDGKLADYDLEFTSMKVTDFLELYQDIPYNSADPDTNHLAEYQLLIIDNQTDALDNGNGALANIKTRISGGMGVIFTRGSINALNQNNYLDSPLFETNQRTYAKLNRIANLGGQYYNFDFTNSGFVNDMNKDATYATEWITKANEGVVTEYPYKIDEAFKMVQNTYSEDALLAYSLADTNLLIGWFCLSDTTSPTVRTKLATPGALPVYSGMYSSSPQDVRNNYYLSNKGNIYYSGIILDAAHDAAGNDTEIELFINTITAAYRFTGHAVTKAPNIGDIHIDELTPDTNSTIKLTKAQIGSRQYIPFTFTVSNSSSKFELSLLWEGSTDKTASWKLYKSTSFGPVLVTDYTEMDNTTYILDIPVSELSGTHKLTLYAINKNNLSTTVDTYIEYNEELPAVTIENDDLIVINPIILDKRKQYLYVDIDYSTIDYSKIDSGNAGDRDKERGNLPEDAVKLEFAVSNIAGKTVIMSVTDPSGNPITLTDNTIYNKDTSKPNYLIGNKEVVEGSYYIYLPVNILSGVSSRDIILTATINAGAKGSSALTLKRRSLFQLD